MASTQFIFHGEHLVASRQELLQSINQLKSQGYLIAKFDARSLTPALLEEALGRTNLFGLDQVLVIEGLHSLPNSSQKKELLALASTTTAQLILWEKRSLTPTMIKKFSGAVIKEFKPTSHVFKWLDSLSGNQTTEYAQHQLLSLALEQDGAELCFHLLSRQIRMLLSIKIGKKIAGAPFMISKLRQQADRFTLSQLLAIHSQLFMIEKRNKTGQAILPLARELDLLNLGL